MPKSNASIWVRAKKVIMLKVAQLNAWYDHSYVVQDLSLEVKRGESSH